MPKHWLKDGDIIDFGFHHLSVIHTPCHSPGSVVFYCEDEHLAFTGDTLFYNNVGRTDLYGGDKEAYKKSLLMHITMQVFFSFTDRFFSILPY